MDIYRIFKSLLYLFGLCFTIYLIIEYGISGGHAPPVGFVVSIVFVLIAFFFMIIDILFKKYLINYTLHLKTNVISIFINLIIIISILLIAL